MLFRSVERIYFLGASGPLRWDNGYWVSRSPLLAQEDLDAVEVWRDGKTLAVLRKLFFKNGKGVVEIAFERLKRVEGHWIARHVRLVSSYGYSLELEVTDYDPNFPVPDGKLHL